MPAALVVLDGSTFFVSDEAGDVLGTASVGFFFQDVHLSTWALSVDGSPIRVLTSRIVDYYSARIFATAADRTCRRKPAHLDPAGATSPTGSGGCGTSPSSASF